MKKFRSGFTAVILLILFSLATSVFTADAKPSVTKIRLSKLERESVCSSARAFLLDHGADVTINLTVGNVGRNLVFLSDWRHLVFIMVARDSAAACLGNERVLAFSMGATLARDANDVGINEFMSYYDNTLQAMRDGRCAPYVALAADTLQSSVLALLREIKWRQFHLRNQGDDIPKGSLTGCGPTALAQLMTYWRHPADCIDWRKVSRTCLWPDGDTAFITPLLVRIGRATKAEYGVKGTSSTVRDIRRAMVREFDFSARARYDYYGQTERELLQSVYVDLRRGQPAMLCGCHHLFLCDGYYRGFYHLNMGWSGNFDGWYRFITPDAVLGKGSMLDGGIVCVEPRRPSENQWVEVQCEQAGTLAEKLDAVQREGVGKLRVSGRLNGSDIRLLRQMAGYVSHENLLSWHGALAELDLSDARIVADTVPYFEFDAAQFAFWVNIDRKGYSFLKMDHKTWLEIGENRALHNAEIDVREVVPDSCYMVSVKTMADVIGPYMFYGCRNLREVKLPRSLSRISYLVLHDCPMLDRVWVPEMPQNQRSSATKNGFPNGCQVETYH